MVRSGGHVPAGCTPGPQSLTELASVAIACFHQKRYEQAAVAILWALKAIPIRGTPESEQGIQRFEASDWIGTQQAFQRLLEEGTPETPTHLFLAVASIRLGNFNQAFHHLMAGYELEIEGAESGPFR